MAEVGNGRVRTDTEAEKSFPAPDARSPPAKADRMVPGGIKTTEQSMADDRFFLPIFPRAPLPAPTARLMYAGLRRLTRIQQEEAR